MVYCYVSMAIIASEIIETVRDLLAEDNQKFFKPRTFVQAINSGMWYAYPKVATINEYTFLKKGTITITSTDVTNKVRSYPLQARTIWVSDFIRVDLSVDYRPLYNNGLTDRWLNSEYDYYIDGSNLVLTFDPPDPGTITYYYKGLPDRLKKDTDPIPDFPDFFFNFFVEYAKWYCKVKENDGDITDAEGKTLVSFDPVLFELENAKAMLNDMDGRPRQFVPNWDMVMDFDP